MKEFTESTTDMYALLEETIKCKARDIRKIRQPIYLLTRYQNRLIFRDRQMRKFKPEEAYITIFRDTYMSSMGRRVRLDDWQFDFKFRGTQIVRIYLISRGVNFQNHRWQYKYHDGFFIKIDLFEGLDILENVSKQCRGWLKRLAKKQICKVSLNIAKPYRTLFRFIPFPPPKPVKRFHYQSWEEQKKQEENIDPIQTLTPQGLQVLEKLRYFVSREKIADFIQNSELSKEAARGLAKIARNESNQHTLSQPQTHQ